MIKVAVIDDHAVVRMGIAACLAAASDCDVQICFRCGNRIKNTVNIIASHITTIHHMAGDLKFFLCHRISQIKVIAHS